MATRVLGDDVRDSVSGADFGYELLVSAEIVTLNVANMAVSTMAMMEADEIHGGAYNGHNKFASGVEGCGDAAVVARDTVCVTAVTLVIATAGCQPGAEEMAAVDKRR